MSHEIISKTNRPNKLAPYEGIWKHPIVSNICPWVVSEGH